jgi:hypothetical protein
MLEVTLVFTLIIGGAASIAVLSTDRGAGIVMAFIVVILALVFSIIPVKETHTYSDAIATKAGGEIFVQAPGFKTMIVTDMKFIDKPLVFKKVIAQNIYGCTPSIDYFVTQSVEIKQQPESNK